MLKTSAKGSRSRRSGRVHVISRSSGWAIKREGTSRAFKVCSKKGSAVKAAKKIAPRGGDVIVHKKDGSIQKWEKR